MRLQIIALSLVTFLTAQGWIYAQGKGEKKAPAGPTRQVNVEVKLIEWSTNRSLDYGFAVNYQKVPGGTAKFAEGDLTLPPPSIPEQGIRIFLDNFRDNGRSIEVVAEALAEVGKVDVLYEGSIQCIVGQAQKLKSGRTVAYSSVSVAGNTLVSYTAFDEMTFELGLTAADVLYDERTDEDYVKITMNTIVKSEADSISVGVDRDGNPSFAPQVDSRNISTTVLVRDQNLLICGVLRSTAKTVREQGVPWVARIPLLGLLFKGRSQGKQVRELLCVIRPVITEGKTGT